MNPEQQQPLDIESQLMLYLADELPAADSAELESRLAIDAELRAQLEGLRQAQEMLSQSLSALDRSEPITETSRLSHQKRLARDMAQWQMDRLNCTEQQPISR